MIMKTADNQRLVYTTSMLRNGGAHDPWPSHAVAYGGMTNNPNPDGTWEIDVFFTLKDTHQYRYWSRPFATYLESEDQWGTQSDYVNPDGLKGYLGEWWNFVCRPTIKNKALYA